MCVLNVQVCVQVCMCGDPEENHHLGVLFACLFVFGFGDLVSYGPETHQVG